MTADENRYRRMNRPLTIAHLSDVHLPLPQACRTDIRLKRMLGMFNWRIRRSRQHLASTLSAIVDDMKSCAPDHIVVTGDLVNLGLPAEHEAAREWLAALGPPEHVTAVPGNHDIYIDDLADLNAGRWQAYMSDDGASSMSGLFPFVRRLGVVALIGLNSAVPTPPFKAYGRLGPDQLARLGRMLKSLGEQKCVRVVLIHHPPLPKMASMHRALQDAESLAGVLARYGAELVLHGHNHRAMLTYARGPLRPVPVVGVPSASFGAVHPRQTLARYNLYCVPSDPGAPIHLMERGIAAPGGAVSELRRIALHLANAAVT